jgi:glycosyltransferase involved in cell wall biosynthesis
VASQTPAHPTAIAFIGDYLYPEGDAAAIRTHTLAKIYRDLGLRVIVIAKGRLRQEDYCQETNSHLFEGIEYRTMNPGVVTWKTRATHPVARLTQSFAALAAVEPGGLRAVITNASGSARHLPFVMAFCRSRAVPLIAEVCEWYDPRQMTRGRLDPAYGVFLAAFHGLLPRVRHFIVVSRLLETHFEGNGRNVIRIPPLVDSGAISHERRKSSHRRVFLYAGSPGRKDLLLEILQGLSMMTTQERGRIEFRLLGIGREDLTRLLGEHASLLERLKDVVEPLGRVSRVKVLETLQEVDFSVLLRPAKRYAIAGFPSKVPESLAAGTPMMLTLTGDLEEYLGDGKAVIKIADTTPEQIARAFRIAIAMDDRALFALRAGARTVAETQFDYRQYLGPIERHLAACRG